MELLEIQALRAARKGHRYQARDERYSALADAFPFEETPDQERAIDEVLGDMESEKPMDRLVCGDVGFGKTEVAMRAAFLAVHDHQQVALLAPTTLLAQQHYHNFRDRYADYPIMIRPNRLKRTSLCSSRWVPEKAAQPGGAIDGPDFVV